jgi:citrate synthase
VTADSPASTRTATLRIGQEEVELPIVHGAEGDDAIDIGRLRSDTGLITLDPGYGNTGACTSAITFLDGEAGILRYRGYPIEQLAEHSTFLEVAYLLIWGELPTREQLDRFIADVTHHTLIREEMRHFFDSFPTDAHPMAVLASGVVGMSTFYPDSQNIFDADAVEITTNRLIAKLPTLAAWSFKKAIGQPYVYPRNDLGYSANLLHMMFAVPTEDYEVDPRVAEALDLLLILHADHEQNASTSTVRLVGSTHANLYASISAGISALWGPLHGGANEAVINTLEHIVADGGDVQKWVDRAKDPNHSFRLAGFGHRVYKNFDPRATIIKAAADRVLAATGADDALFEVAKRLEEVALSDEYFVSRKLYPNVDFYSGLIYRAIGFPKNMFTNCFAIGRLPGWIAQWREMMSVRETKIGRPRQVYVGPPTRDYTPIEQR